MRVPEGYITGTFLSENKNRFLCTVEIGGAKECCYIASSCRLDNFIDLRGKTVLLKATASKKAVTRYAVCAVKHKQSYILLNTSLANKAIENTLHSSKLVSFGKRNDIKRECTIDGYKADFYIPCSKTIVEVKSVISTNKVALFPTVYSERALAQLISIEEHLQNGYKARLAIVSLNPYVTRIEILKNSEFYDEFSRCVDLGLEVDAFSCKLADDGSVYVHKRITWLCY